MRAVRLFPSVALLRTQSDDRLVALARDGWEPAFTALVERYRREVLRGCMRVLPEPRAEDATQQVFMAAWRALRRGDEVRDVRPWLLRIAHNTALNALRVPGYDHAELAESLRATEAPQAELERREVVRATLAGLAALPERQRQALLRSAVEGASHAQIAAGLGIKEGAARQLVLRARSTMRGAATALTPAPMISWALERAGDASLADAVAGGSAAGASGLLAKAGVIAVVAGGAVAAPVAVQHRRDAGPAAAQAASLNPVKAVRHARRATLAVAATATPIATAAPARHVTPAASPTVQRQPARSDSGSATPVRQDGGDDGGSGSSDSSGSGGGDDHRSTSGSSGSTETEHSGSDDSSGSGTSGSGDPSGSSGSSGSDGSDDHVTATATVTPTVTAAPTSGSGDSSSSGSSGPDGGRLVSGDDHVDGGGS
ncbi:MAG: hypothetical protein QOE86_3604 [Solirubrobacteraceae bacterium]|nr:hypothetical protein [Solirubrobacteraceae bacterium]